MKNLSIVFAREEVGRYNFPAHLLGVVFMTHLFRCVTLTAVGGLSLALANSLAAQEPGWTSRVLKLGEERAVSEQTPILERPYRPLHFYGNAVRRNYYRGNPWPLPRDILITTAFLAPTPREREAQLEQRLAGPNLLLVDREGVDRPAAEDALPESPSEGAEGETREGVSPSVESNLDSGVQSPEQALAATPEAARSGTAPGESSSRRNRRNRQ